MREFAQPSPGRDGHKVWMLQLEEARAERRRDILEMKNEDFIDTEYWADPERNVRRKSGERDVILTATSACSKAECLIILTGLGLGDSER